MRVVFLVIFVLAGAGCARAQDITAMISQYRREHGLPAVRRDPRLTAVAQRQAQAMAASGIMAHDVAGPFTRRVAGAAIVAGGENIAAGTATWADTLRMWKQSPGHNSNLLTPGADLLGVAVARNPETRYKIYWAMVIGRRDARRPPEAVAATRGAAGPPLGDAVNRAISSVRSLLQ